MTLREPIHREASFVIPDVAVMVRSRQVVAATAPLPHATH